MSKSSLFTCLFLALAAGTSFSRYAIAESSHSSSTAGDVLAQRFKRLVSDLTARGDTNTLNQVTSLLAARDVLAQTRDASTAVVLLQRLRSGRTNEVIEMLEMHLDGALTGLGYSPQEIGESQIKTLKRARDYRAKYPRQQTKGVTKAFELLDK